MPTTFKPKKQIIIRTKTPQDQLILCSECGGLQAMARTSIRLDCETCNGTGYENLHSDFVAAASYRPGSVKQWNYETGATTYFGECSIKLDYRYRTLLENASHILMDGVQWKFTFLREPGEAMGQRRIVLALSRKG